MCWLDIAIGIALIYSLWIGYKKGFVNRAMALVAVIVAAMLSGSVSKLLENIFTQISGFPPVAIRFATLALGYVLVYKVIIFIGKRIDRGVRILHLSLVNRLIGMVFSLLIALLVMSYSFVVLDRFIPRKNGIEKVDIRNISHYYDQIKPFATTFLPSRLLPNKMVEKKEQAPVRQFSV